jgi:hypothetical protein
MCRGDLTAHDDVVRVRRWHGRHSRHGTPQPPIRLQPDAAPDRAAAPPWSARRTRRDGRVVLWTVAAVATAAVVGRYGELTRPALAAVLAAGVGVGAVGLARRAGSAAPAVGRAAAAAWLAWLVVLVAWESYTRFVDRDVPTLSDLLDPVFAHRAVRAGATLLWFAAGVWLVNRPSNRRGEP